MEGIEREREVGEVETRETLVQLQEPGTFRGGLEALNTAAGSLETA